MSRIMITNGGPHPADKWAMMTAERVFDITPNVTGERLVQAQSLQLAIAGVLLPFYAKIQHSERSKLDTDVRNMLQPYEVEVHLDQIMHAITATAQDTPWGPHFASPAVQTAARELIGNDIATELHVERLWHADHNPGSAESQCYVETFKGAA